jgi:4-amino-4-deoxychorismate lyase
LEGPFRQSDLDDPSLRVIETLGWDGQRLRRRDLHLARARRSCTALGFRHDPVAIERALAKVRGPEPLRVRLTLGRAGDAEVTTNLLPQTPSVWRVGLSQHRLNPDDPWLAHKTTRRALYDHTRATLPTGMDEVLFLNEAGHVCEGTITNFFFDLGDGLCTPPRRCGLLPGILRAELLESGQCREEVLRHPDLAQAGIWVGNALRGLIPACISLESVPSLPHKQC